MCDILRGLYMESYLQINAVNTSMRAKSHPEMNRILTNIALKYRNYNRQLMPTPTGNSLGMVWSACQHFSTRE